MALPSTRPMRREIETPPGVLMMERHFTLHQLAEQWGFSYDFVLEHFRDEPGVVVAGIKANNRKRGRPTIRVPESVAVRVYSRMVTGA